MGKLLILLAVISTQSLLLPATVALETNTEFETTTFTTDEVLNDAFEDTTVLGIVEFEERDAFETTTENNSQIGEISEKLVQNNPLEKSVNFSSITNSLNLTQLQNYTQQFINLFTNLTSSIKPTRDEAIAGAGDAEDLTKDEVVATSSSSSDQHEIQDLLRGILDDEFESSEEDGSDSAESEEFFRDDSDEEESQNDEIDEEQADVEEVKLTENLDTTTTPTPLTSTLLAIIDDVYVAEMSDLTQSKAALDSDIIQERTSRSENSYEKSGRARNGNKQKQSGKQELSTGNIAKYNKYVDAVFKRMNSLIRAKRMDPLRVNLYAGGNQGQGQGQGHGQGQGNGNGNGSGAAAGSGGNKNKGNGGKMKGQQGKGPANKNNKNKNKNNNKMPVNAGQNKRAGNSHKKNNGKQGKHGHNHRAQNQRFNNNNNKRRAGNNRPRLYENDEAAHEEVNAHGQRQAREEEDDMADNKMRPSSMETRNKNVTLVSSHSSVGGSRPSTPATSSVPSVSSTTTMATSTTTATTTTTTTTTTDRPSSSTTSASESKEMKGQASESSGNSSNSSSRPTRGVLHGLSTLRRAGSVKVIRQGHDVRLVRAKFLLGPVALDILSKKSGGSSKSGNSTATATARSLKGILEIRLKNSGPTRIRRLRVFPPSNVRVEGETNGMKKQGYRKITPVAARRLMSVANQVVRQSDSGSNGGKGGKGSNRNPSANTKAKTKPKNSHNNRRNPSKKTAAAKNTNKRRAPVRRHGNQHRN